MTKVTTLGLLLSLSFLCKMAAALPGTAGQLPLDTRELQDLEEWYTRELYDNLDERSLFSAVAKTAVHHAHVKHKHGKGPSIHIDGSSNDNNNNEDRREYVPGAVEERSFLGWMDPDDLE